MNTHLCSAPSGRWVAFKRHTWTRMSKLHLYKRAWKPEPGSPADLRMRMRSKGTKIHWHGSSCIHVRGRFSFLHKDRTVSGYVFEDTPKELRCETCDQLFNEA